MQHCQFNANLYKLYVFCLPLGRFIELPLSDFLNKIFTQFSTLIMLVGMFCLLLQHNIRTQKRLKPIVTFYVFMAFYSFLASVVLLLVFLDPIESPLYSCLNDIILYFFALMSIYYNYFNLTHNVNIKQLFPIFNLQIIILLIVGYMQWGAMLGNNLCLSSYSFLSSVFALRELDWLTVLERGVTFWGSEPASASILCFWTIPYMTTSILYSSKLKRGFFILANILLCILILSSNSSSLLILYAANILLFTMIALKLKLKRIFFVFSCFLGFIIATFYCLDLNLKSNINNNDSQSFSYVIYGKVVDRQNPSTAMRASTIINDMKIFYDYPFTGVGNGNQGFFYRKNMAFWVQSSEEVQNIMYSTTTIANGGGNFFPAYISGFGLIGIFILIIFIWKYHKIYKSSFLQENVQLKTIFEIGMILFLFSSWYVVGIKQNETIIFLLCLPFVAQNKNIHHEY